MTVHDLWTIDSVLAAFDEHLRRARGTCPEVRRTYTRFARAFLDSVAATPEMWAAEALAPLTPPRRPCRTR